MLRALNNFQYALICLIPMALVTGPFLPDLFISLIAIFLIFNIYYYKNYQYISNFVAKIFWTYCAIILLSSFFSSNIFLSLESSLFYFRYGLFCLAVWYALKKNKHLIRYFYFSLIFTYFILLADGYYQYFTDYNFLGYHYGGNRLSGLFGEEKILGNYLIRLLPLLCGLHLLINKNKSYTNLTTLLIILLTGSLIIITGERTAVFLFIVFVTLFILLTSNVGSKKLLFVLLCFFIITLLFQKNIYQRLVNNTFENIGISTVEANDESNIYFISKYHQGMLVSSLKMFLDNPVIGVGPKLYREECSKIEYSNTKAGKNESFCSTHPHNVYFQILAETGILGTLPILFTLLIICKSMLLQFKSLFLNSLYFKDYQICLIIGIFITLVPMVPSMNFFNNWISAIYYLPIGFIFYTLSLEGNEYFKIKEAN